MSVIYKAVKSKDENGRICFGIEMSRQYSDVFENEADATGFADLCNRCALSEIHFDDAVNDYITNKNTPR